MALRLVLIEDHQALREGLELLRKLEASPRVHAVAIALRDGVVDPPGAAGPGGDGAAA